jgi:hypothetical protein
VHCAMQVGAPAVLLLLLLMLLLLRLPLWQRVALQELDLEPAQPQHHAPQHKILYPCAQRHPDTTSKCMSSGMGVVDEERRQHATPLEESSQSMFQFNVPAEQAHTCEISHQAHQPQRSACRLRPR